MSAEASLLDRIHGGMDYSQLQQFFAELVAEAERAKDNPGLDERIDQIIARLVRERDEDQRGLSEVQSQYESFKEDNRGVIGWFKRHIPFTDTRRQELEHRGEVDNQSAEILADNMVIAR